MSSLNRGVRSNPALLAALEDCGHALAQRLQDFILSGVLYNSLVSVTDQGPTPLVAQPTDVQELRSCSRNVCEQ